MRPPPQNEAAGGHGLVPVETAGFPGGLYPNGIPIGQVSSVSTDPVSTQKQIAVRPAVDFSSLDYVLVVLSPGSR